MMYTIVIGLVIALLVVAVAVNAIQQHKEKQDAERKQQISKHKAIVEETETVLMNSANVPLSVNAIKILHNRIHAALKAMQEIQPDMQGLKQRVSESDRRISEMNGSPDAPQSDDNIQIPDGEKQLIGLIQGIKKLRSVMRSEHSKGKVDTQVFMTEDRRLEKIQLKINIDSHIKRGKSAQTTNMLGSARQYYEKALATLEAQSYNDEYITSKKEEILGYLHQITSELKSTNARDARKNEDKDDLDELFAPKKKW